jgi:hypothetical protein
MKKYALLIYLDSLRAGHAYIELQSPEAKEGEVYGFYPAKFDEKREVLFGEGQLRKDHERLEDSKQNQDIQQTGKQLDLTEAEYDKLAEFLKDQSEKPHYYFLIGYNCIDFIQDTYVAAKGKEAGHFLELYSKEELDELSWLGTYANLVKLGAGFSYKG